MTDLQVLVDATCLSGDPGASGVGRYARGLLGGLAGTADLTAIVTPGTDLPPGVGRAEVTRRWRTGRLHIHEHRFRLPLELKGLPGDVFHALAPDPPRRVRSSWVQTLHDVIPLVDPASPPAMRRLWSGWAERYREADAVIAVSAYSANEGARVLGLDRRRVHVIHHGVDEIFSPLGQSGACADGRPYVLAVGEHSARKRFDHAFAAVGHIVERGLPHRLVVAGRLNHWNADELHGLVARSAHPERVEVAGFVADLPALYRGAAAVVVPSAHEGFGFVALEAMASGVPVVAYANSATPEVAGDAAVLVEDGDVTALGLALADLLVDPMRCEELAAAGQDRARSFTWARTARMTLEVYRSVVKS